MKTLIKISATIAILAFTSGNLPWIITQVRKAQVQLLQDTKASKWPKALSPSGQ